jgi:hypothetical protein
MLDLTELERLIAEANPLPWKLRPDIAGGKEEMYCYWHAIGPIETPGCEPDANSRLAHAAVQALPALLARLRAAEAQAGRLREACEGKSRMIQAQKGARDDLHAENMRYHAALETIEAIESGRVTATRTAGEVARAALEAK